MRPTSSGKPWFAAAVCVLAMSGFATAEEGVVRISDAASRPGIVRMGGAPNNASPVTYGAAFPPVVSGGPAASGWGPQQPFGNAAGYGQNPAWQQVGYAPHASAYNPACCTNGAAMDPYPACSCSDGTCGHCGPACNSGYCDSGYCDAGYCDAAYCEQDECWDTTGDCYYGGGHKKRMLRLFAKATPKGSCDGASWPKRWCRGQQLNYLARNQRLSNFLFGWLVPSGCNGQGCPPVGKYQITYADQPDYAHPQDGMAYGAQGYGVPLSVPLAPNVRQSYNYSWGTPSSRITPMGQYDPNTSPQPLYRQCW